MKTTKIITALLASGLLLSGFVFFSQKNESQSNSTPAAAQESGEGIHWHTFQEAVELGKKEKKKVFIDVYTSWCGWCKVMDKNTFTNPVIASYINEKFYAVKLDAEMKDTVRFNNNTFVNPSPNVPRSTHQLAQSLLGNKLSYPTTVYLDEDFNLITQVPGYLQPAQLEPIVKYFGENVYKTIQWEEYSKTFKSEIASPPPAVTPPLH
ncbi:MAG: DUF255 domain-containing protein [Bacteroidetes bacterium]|nr:DUF255 domain-containing protein [Bacteroidota bacterium]